MISTKKAPSGVGTPSEASTGKSGALNSFNFNEFNTVKQKMQVKIADMLPHGEENAVSTRQLLSMTGYRTARRLQKEIEAERATGSLILSASTGGYYLPCNGEAGRAEMRRYERTLYRRAVNTLRTLRAVRRALHELDGQISFEEGGRFE